MILDNLKFRKLENGYTIKYHVTKMEDPAILEPKQNHFGGEIYVQDIAQLKAAVLMLIDKHTQQA